MAATPSPTPKLQFLDTSGAPLAGGKVYTYAAGTTTPLVTYADSAATTNNPNPIILDSRGEAEIWLDLQSYKFKLTTSTDVEIWTVDNINTGPYTTAAATAAAVTAVGLVYAASNGSSLIGYVAAGTGGATQTVQTKLRQIINVKDYGAVGDGVADDTLAIQRAITNTTGAVFFPSGTYLTTGMTLTTGKQLIGENRATSVLKLKTALSGTGMINATYADGIVVENLTIDGGSLPGTKNGLINFFGCNSARIENNNFINTDQFAVACNSQNYTTIRGNKFLMTQHVGAWIDTSTVVAGSGGPISQTGLVGTISGPAGVGGVQAAFTYATTAAGAVDPTTIVFSNNGSGYLTLPTASFPAVPGSSCTARYGGAQVVAITHANTLSTGENVEISHNYFEGGGCNLSVRNSNIFGNVSRFIIYGAAFVSQQSANVNRNTYSNNLVHRMGYCNLTGATYTNTYIGQDTDNTVASGFELWGLYEACHNNVLYENAGNGISFGAQGGSTNSNIIYDNGKYWATVGLYTTRGIQISYGNATYNGNYSVHANNRCFDQNGATGTQGYGIGTQGSSVVGLKLIDNDCANNRTGSYDINGATLTFFRGRRIEGRAASDPTSLASGAAADYSVTVPGLDTGKWLLSGNFSAVTTEPMMMTVRYSAANTAIVRLFNFSASAYDLPAGSFYVQAEEIVS